MPAASNPLPWLAPGEPFPAVERAWGARDPAPGLLAAGNALTVPVLRSAYGAGIFPWFSDGQPVLWWSPDPRMVLPCAEFRLHRSLRKTVQRFVEHPGCEVRIDHDFRAVITACAGSPRAGQDGTWIVAPMIEAYVALHGAGLAHSVETWVDGRLVAGLYCVSIGQAVFGESMFTRVTDGSKIALAALVAFCRQHGPALIDCQQNTRHLASFGAREIPRAEFVRHVAAAAARPAPRWHFLPVYWERVLSRDALSAASAPMPGGPADGAHAGPSAVSPKAAWHTSPTCRCRPCSSTPRRPIRAAICRGGRPARRSPRRAT